MSNKVQEILLQLEDYYSREKEYEMKLIKCISSSSCRGETTDGNKDEIIEKDDTRPDDNDDDLAEKEEEQKLYVILDKLRDEILKLKIICNI